MPRVYMVLAILAAVWFLHLCYEKCDNHSEDKDEIHTKCVKWHHCEI